MKKNSVLSRALALAMAAAMFATTAVTPVTATVEGADTPEQTSTLGVVLAEGGSVNLSTGASDLGTYRFNEDGTVECTTAAGTETKTPTTEGYAVSIEAETGTVINVTATADEGRTVEAFSVNGQSTETGDAVVRQAITLNDNAVLKVSFSAAEEIVGAEYAEGTEETIEEAVDEENADDGSVVNTETAVEEETITEEKEETVAETVDETIEETAESTADTEDVKQEETAQDADVEESDDELPAIEAEPFSMDGFGTEDATDSLDPEKEAAMRGVMELMLDITGSGKTYAEWKRIAFGSGDEELVGAIPTADGIPLADQGKAKTVSLSYNGSIPYDAYTTHYYAFNGVSGSAYCVQPPNGSPAQSSYTVYEITNNTMRHLIYNSYRAPGYMKNPDIRAAYAGLSREDGYTISHLILSYAYAALWDNSAGAWTMGVSAERAAKVREITEKLHEGYVPDTFHCYFLDGNGAQDIVGWTPVGSFRLKKVTADPEITTESGIKQENGKYVYALNDAEFGVYSDAACTKPVTVRYTTMYKGQELQRVEQRILTTAWDGRTNAAVDMAPGTYYIKERKASLGYDVNPKVFKVMVKADATWSGNWDGGASLPTTQVPETPKNPTGGVYIVKESTNPDMTEGNNCYSFKGATYKLYKSKADAEANKSAVGTMVCNENGVSNKIKDLNGGTYYYKETVAPKGYELNKAVGSVVVKENSTSTATAIEVTDTPKADPFVIRINKLDAETGKASTDGTGSLAGAQFMVRYYGGEYGKDNLPEAATRSWLLQTVKMEDGSFMASIADEACLIKEQSDAVYVDEKGIISIPYGTIVVEETKAPTGYALPADKVVYYAVLNDKFYANPQNYVTVNNMMVADVEVREPRTRGNIKFTKVDEKDAPMANVAFLVTDTKTGEAHVVVTGSDGTFDSAAVLTENTAANANKNDAAYNAETGKIDSSKLDASAPVWFSGKADDNGKADPTKGALVYGNYVLHELRCAANAGKTLADDIEFTIRRNNATVTLGEGGKIVNISYKLSTKASNSSTGKKAIKAAPGQEIKDVAAWDGIPEGTKVKSVTSAYAKGETADKDKLLATTETEFTVNKVKGSQTFLITVDASDYAGGSIYITEKFYGEDGEIISEHSDREDKDQTVHIPKIGTTLTDAKTQLHISYATKDVVNEDKINFTKVRKVQQTAVGFLADKETGNALKTDGTPSKLTAAEVQAYEGEGETPAERTASIIKYLKDNDIVYATTEFMPEGEEDEFGLVTGSATVTFKYNGVKLAGKSVVAAEKMIPSDGDIILEHFDLEDKDQTVNLPKIGTTATDKADGDKFVVADDKAAINDRITYSNFDTSVQYDIVTKAILKGETKKDDKVLKTVNVKAQTIAKEAGNINIKVPFDATGLEGKQVYIAEYVYPAGMEELVAVHDDRDSTDQTVTIPGMGTTQTDSKTGLHMVLAEEEVVTHDDIEYKGHKVGQTYPVVGIEMDKDGKAYLKTAEVYTEKTVEELFALGTGETAEERHKNLVAALDELNILYATTTFVPKTEDGVVRVEFKFNGIAFAGKSLVAAEATIDDNGLFATHIDKDDEGQQVDVPKIGTTAVDKADGDKKVKASKDTVITDTVAYEKLLEGTYKAYTEAYKKGETAADDKLLAKAEKEVQLEGDGTFDIDIAVDTSNVVGKVYITEKIALIDEDGTEKIIAEHINRDDNDQTVVIPGIGTTQTDSKTKEHVALAEKETVLNDTIKYEGLEVGKPHTAFGIEMNEKGNAYLKNGTPYTDKKVADLYALATGDTAAARNESLKAALDKLGIVYAMAEFTPEKESGEAVVQFKFDGTYFAGKSVVAAEAVFDEHGLLATHIDKDDEKQEVDFPKIGTTAVDKADGDKIVNATANAVIRDILAYSTFPKGTKVTIEATLYEATTGNEVVVDGKKVVVTKNATIGGTGSEFVDIPFNATGFGNKKLVVGERVYIQGTKTLIAEHVDMKDEGQTVTMRTPTVTPTPVPHTTTTVRTTPKTGETPLGTVAVIAVLAGIGLLAAAIIRKRRA